MRHEQIEPGKRYESTAGNGVVVEKHGRGRTANVRFRVTDPIPRGILNLHPRTILRELPETPTPATDSPK